MYGVDNLDSDILDTFNKKDIENKHTLLDDIHKFREKYKYDYDEFFEKEKKKSNGYYNPKILSHIYLW